jgi:hypothetical protein
MPLVQWAVVLVTVVVSPMTYETVRVIEGPDGTGALGSEQAREARRQSSVFRGLMSELPPGLHPELIMAPNVLRLSCKARLVMLALSYPMGRALPAPNAG